MPKSTPRCPLYVEKCMHSARLQVVRLKLNPLNTRQDDLNEWVSVAVWCSGELADESRTKWIARRVLLTERVAIKNTPTG
jgi:hypothetical protein